MRTETETETNPPTLAETQAVMRAGAEAWFQALEKSQANALRRVAQVVQESHGNLNIAGLTVHTHVRFCKRQLEFVAGTRAQIKLDTFGLASVKPYGDNGQ